MSILTKLRKPTTADTGKEHSRASGSHTRYASDTALAEYCDAHYGPAKFGVDNFSKTVARLCTDITAGMPRTSALDLGCAVGRTSFELARYYEKVMGIDGSQQFIDVAKRIQKKGKTNYRLIEEAELISDHRIALADFGLEETAQKVSFRQGDAQQLEQHFRNYDLVVLSNLIDRLSHPGRFLDTIHQRLTPTGILVIASPYDWLERFTPKKNWLGGRFRSGSPIDSFSGLSKRLNKHFSLFAEPQDIEFVQRVTARTYHHAISQITFWQRQSR